RSDPGDPPVRGGRGGRGPRGLRRPGTTREAERGRRRHPRRNRQRARGERRGFCTSVRTEGRRVSYSSFMESTKKCPDCGQAKSVAEFSRNAARPDGLQFYCKSCYSTRAARTYRERQSQKGRGVRAR